MKENLFDTAPDFNQPLAVLLHCHGRIRKQLQTLERLAAHLQRIGHNLDTQQAAQAVLRYFGRAAQLHHEDEEQDLLPMLHGALSGTEAAHLDALCNDIRREHREAELAWQILEPQLQMIAEDRNVLPPSLDAARFIAIYTAHMDREELHLMPLARRLLGVRQLQQLGSAMRKRRGILFPAGE